MGTVRSFWTLSSVTFVSFTGNQVLEALSDLLGRRRDKLCFLMVSLTVRVYALPLYFEQTSFKKVVYRLQPST